jgi:hypothetical protein
MSCSTLKVVVLAPKSTIAIRWSAGIGHLVRQQLAGVLEREGLDVDHPRMEARGLDCGTALVDVLGAGGHQQHIQHFRVALEVADHLEVEADLLHRKRDVLVGLHLDLAFELTPGQPLRHLDDLGDGRVAADGDGDITGLGAGALDRALDRLTHGSASTMAFSLMEFGGVGSAA